jgi:hypothetical protein
MPAAYILLFRTKFGRKRHVLRAALYIYLRLTDSSSCAHPLPFTGQLAIKALSPFAGELCILRLQCVYQSQLQSRALSPWLHVSLPGPSRTVSLIAIQLSEHIKEPIIIATGNATSWNLNTRMLLFWTRVIDTTWMLRLSTISQWEASFSWNVIIFLQNDKKYKGTLLVYTWSKIMKITGL